jgi:hypothetical protein
MLFYVPDSWIFDASTFVCLALRKVEKYLGLEKLYVLGTNCGKHVSYSNQHFRYLECMMFWTTCLMLLSDREVKLGCQCKVYEAHSLEMQTLISVV